MAEMESKTKDPNSWIYYSHPDYVKAMRYFQFCDDFYNGGESVLSKDIYLCRHFLENDKHYASRKLTGKKFYDNQLKSAVRELAGTIFSSRDFEINFPKKDANKILDGFLEDVNGDGETINTFMKTVCLNTLVHGVTFIYIEPQTTFGEIDEILANSNQIVGIDLINSMGLIPRWNNILRCDVKDWLYYNNTLWKVKIRAQNYVRNSLRDDPSVIKEKYLVWEKISDNACQWTYYDDKGIMINKTPTIVTIPYIPLVPVFYDKKFGFNGEPLILDAAYTNCALYNLDNIIANYVDSSSIARYIFPIKSEKEKDKIKDIDFSAKAHWTEPEGSVRGIRSISLDQSPYASANTEREKRKAIIASNLKQRLMSQDATGVAASGESKSIDMIPTNNEVAAIAQNLQVAENMAHYYTAMWLNGGDVPAESYITRKYPIRFDLRSLTAVFNDLTGFKNNGFPQTFIQEKIRNAVQKDMLWDSLPEDIQKKITSEIDAMAEKAQAAAENIESSAELDKGIEDFMNEYNKEVEKENSNN